MPSAAITITILVILGLAIGVPAVGWYTTSNNLEVCQLSFESFRSETKALGMRSELEQREIEHSLATAATNIQGDLNAKQTELDNLYAKHSRMLRDAKAHASSSKESRLSDAASGFSCPDGRAGLAEALARLDLGIQPILKSRDEAIIRNQACKEYVEGLQQTFKGD